MKRAFFLFLLICLYSKWVGAFDLESFRQSFVLETRKINIEKYPDAFNPSIINLEGKLVMSFRINPFDSYYPSWIGIQVLNDKFYPIADPQIIQLKTEEKTEPLIGDDARLIVINNKIYLIYCDVIAINDQISPFRLWISELIEENGCFFVKEKICFSEFETTQIIRSEKNWVPFCYKEELLLAYSIRPHKIFKPTIKTGRCVKIASTTFVPLFWNWGELRGGTPALLLPEGEYLSFFHSSRKIASDQSHHYSMLHYFMGAYTFSAEPPFKISRISSQPIVGKGFYDDANIPKNIRVVFPGGFIFDKDFIWIVYGRQDCEIWVIKLDRKKLLNSLKYVSSY